MVFIDPVSGNSRPEMMPKLVQHRIFHPVVSLARQTFPLYSSYAVTPLCWRSIITIVFLKSTVRHCPIRKPPHHQEFATKR